MVHRAWAASHIKAAERIRARRSGRHPRANHSSELVCQQVTLLPRCAAQHVARKTWWHQTRRWMPKPTGAAGSAATCGTSVGSGPKKPDILNPSAARVRGPGDVVDTCADVRVAVRPASAGHARVSQAAPTARRRLIRSVDFPPCVCRCLPGSEVDDGLTRDHALESPESTSRTRLRRRTPRSRSTGRR